MYGNPSHPPPPHTQTPQGASAQSHTTIPPLILGARLHELVVAGTGQNERLDPAVEHGLNKIAEEFLDEIMTAAADLALHRGSTVVDVKDVLFPLERFYDLGVAGFTDLDARPQVTDTRHRQTMRGTDAHQLRKGQISRSISGSSHASQPQSK